MKQEEFIRLKQGGDTVMQYLNKFNHLSQYAIDQVNTDLKKKNCFMRGLNDRLQRKMATCLDIPYSRVVSTTLAVEAKNTNHGKSKRFGGDRSNQGPEKRTRLVIQPFNQNHSSPCPPSYPFKQPVFIRPTTAPASTNQPSAPGTRFPALPSSSTGCFNCGKSRHFIKDCQYPKRNKFNNQQNSRSSNEGKGNMASTSTGKNVKKIGRIYYTQVATTPEGEPVMMGMFLLANHPTVILFDSGASHTFLWCLRPGLTACQPHSVEWRSSQSGAGGAVLLSGRSVERRSDCGHFGSVDWRTCVRIKVSGHLCIKCPCDLVGWRGDLARVASWRRLGLGQAGSVFVAGGGPRARRRSSGVGCPCPRLGSGEA
jgi:hypothetical protein